jgi:hypothetical protein
MRPTVAKTRTHVLANRSPGLAAAMDRAAARAGCALSDAKYNAWFKRLVEHLGVELGSPRTFVKWSMEEKEEISRREFRCFTKVIPIGSDALVADYDQFLRARRDYDLAALLEELQPVSPAVLLNELVARAPELRLYPLLPPDVSFPGTVATRTGKLMRSEIH